MQIDITGQHFDITPGLRERVGKILARVNNHAEEKVQRVHVVLEVVKRRHRCNIHLSAGADAYVANDEADDMYTAIDRAAGKVARQMETAKSRQREQRNR